MSEPTFNISASTPVAASPDEVYAVVTDIARMGEWSPENTGGTWVEGEPAAVSSIFEGRNRGGEREWTTRCEVIAATPGRRFAWAVLGPYDKENLVWGFDIEPEGDGSKLTQWMRLGEVPEAMWKMRDHLPEERRATFLDDRAAFLEEGMRKTLAGIKAATEA